MPVIKTGLKGCFQIKKCAAFLLHEDTLKIASVQGFDCLFKLKISLF